MTKVYPKASSSPPLDPHSADNSAAHLTVWKKSLLFNCDGFTVFDSRGNLLYRVDNYISADGLILLMDAAGTTLVTIRRKKLSLGDTWMVFDGETAKNPRLLVRKNMNLLNPKCLAHVTSGCQKKASSLYQIEGSYAQRCCAVYDEKRRPAAEIKQKEAAVRGVAFGKDIFRLVVQPGLDAAVAMAMVIILDRMFS